MRVRDPLSSRNSDLIVKQLDSHRTLVDAPCFVRLEGRPVLLAFRAIKGARNGWTKS